MDWNKSHGPIEESRFGLFQTSEACISQSVSSISGLRIFAKKTSISCFDITEPAIVSFSQEYGGGNVIDIAGTLSQPKSNTDESNGFQTGSSTRFALDDVGTNRVI